MRISRIKIENFRGLASVDIPLSRFGCLIGENNAGKSSVFQALNFFFRGASALSSDFLHASKRIRIQVAFAGITDSDLLRLEEKHRTRISPDIVDGSLTLVKVYDGPGKGELRIVSMVPAEARYGKVAIDETLKTGLSADVIAANVKATYPEIYDKLDGKVNRAAVRRELKETISNLASDELVMGEEKLPTGMDKSISPLLPEPIYIPAVKELNDDVKTTDSSTFGRLLTLLFGQIEHQLPSLAASFGSLRKQLNVVTLEDGGVEDNRLDEVREIEGLIQRNLQDSFPRANVRLEIPPPELRSLLAQAEISINDGVSGHFRTKGDGLRRSVTFAMLRTYVDLKTAQPDGAPSAQQPYLLLFEEPEVFLHPRAQKQLFDALKFFSDFNDVLVTTHSPSFFAPRATGTFVKIIKDHESSPPASRACVVDVHDMESRDQFEIIKHENNEAAFFSDSVLLVEGPSDHILIPHISRTLNPGWDFSKHSATIAKVEGKGSISRYRSFFEKFEMKVSVLADLDALQGDFDKLGASEKCKSLRDLLIGKVTEAAAAQTAVDSTEPTGETLRKMRKSGALQGLWREAQKKREEFERGECEWHDLNLAIGEFFNRSASQAQRDILRSPADESIREVKVKLILALREENIFVWERGAIEDYYPPLEENQSSNKNVRAQDFCERYVTADDIRGLPAFGGGACEFDLIFEKFFNTGLSQPSLIPAQASGEPNGAPA
ncbi:ATP-dependent endonuclease [Kitasatospora sp. NPDC057965]|uniref:ATP-dependent nuclease n=1 Tax=Kitasatospora sp. NPDC057965 TaxID=3346291 RepID=UPI0036DAA738